MGPYVPNGGDCTACNVLYEGTGTCIINDEKLENVTYEYCQEYSGTCSRLNSGCGQCDDSDRSKSRTACEGYTGCSGTNDCVWTPNENEYTPTYSAGYGLPHSSKGFGQACDISKYIKCSSEYSCNQYTFKGGGQGQLCGFDP